MSAIYASNLHRKAYEQGYFKGLNGHDWDAYDWERDYRHEYLRGVREGQQERKHRPTA